MLLEIKHYLMQKKSANLQELALHFQQDPQLMRNMLEHWIRKGKVCCRTLTPNCGSRCHQCPSTKTIIYQWL